MNQKPDLNKIVRTTDLGDCIASLSIAKFRDPISQAQLNAAKQAFYMMCKSGNIAPNVEQACRGHNTDNTRGIYEDSLGARYISGHTLNILTSSFTHSTGMIDQRTHDNLMRITSLAFKNAKDYSPEKQGLKPL